MQTKLFASVILFGSALGAACGATPAVDAGASTDGAAGTDAGGTKDATAADVMIHDAALDGWHPTK